jgi:hypothetical protein
MAAECYDKLTQLYPDHTDYRLYHAQSLYNAFMFPEAIAVMAQVFESSQLRLRPKPKPRLRPKPRPKPRPKLRTKLRTKLRPKPRTKPKPRPQPTSI